MDGSIRFIEHLGKFNVPVGYFGHQRGGEGFCTAIQHPSDVYFKAQG